MSGISRRGFLATAAAGAGTLAVGARTGAAIVASPSGVQRLETGWRFTRADLDDSPSAPGFDDARWEPVSLPHTARIESLVTGPVGSPTSQWQGTCWYRRTLMLEASVAPDAQVWLRFGAAMNVADVWLDGRPLGTHLGGWTPFAFDLTGLLVRGRPAVLAVRLDNRDNAITGPKPLKDLDFNPYHGLYRMVELVVKPPVHLTDPILADRPGSGGVLVRTIAATAAEASLQVQAHVRNAAAVTAECVVRHRLLAPDGRAAAEWSDQVRLSAGGSTDVTGTLVVPSPSLWHPTHPNLYALETTVSAQGQVTDTERTTVGIRRFEVSGAGLRINGAPFFARGTNRHQEYPYVGYALSDDAQWRDARLIKDAGFDYVRLSHYLHAPAFMDACDALGILLMDAIPGWQYFNRDDPRFTELQYANVRAMVRRDRNHPSVLLWESSLNETGMPPEFIARTHAITHQELPGDQTFTCGWMEGYDVFIQARQHGGCTKMRDRACVVSEYGDWEYYAQNAGLNQAAWRDLAPDHANSRQLRWHGETRLLQQATNFQEAANDNRKTIAFADGLWVMFDYNRGYAPDIESSGCADLFRLPKPSYHFFRSQRDASERYALADAGPMVFIANDWTADSPLPVRVYSNAEQVELALDGRVIGRQRPDRDRMSTHLKHAPFSFVVPRFAPGTLTATALIGGRRVARHSVRTPGAPTALRLRLAEHGRPFAAHGKDVVMLHATLVDQHGTPCTSAWEHVAFGAIGPLRLVGANPYSTEAGIASILLETDARAPRGAVYALAVVRDGERLRALGGSLGIGAGVAGLPFVIHYTTDRSAPTAASPRSAGPIPASEGLRAALVAGGRVMATLDTTTPKFRVAGSTAPTSP